jgi:uncharacterized radical SAM superfamily Fe-S cluster-containing enzyme
MELNPSIQSQSESASTGTDGVSTQIESEAGSSLTASHGDAVEGLSTGQEDGGRLLEEMSGGPGSTWKALHAPEWKAFLYDHGAFIIHVPSSTVLETDYDTARRLIQKHQKALKGQLPLAEKTAQEEEEEDLSFQEALDDLAKQMPKNQGRSTKIDISALSLNMAQGCNLRCNYCFAGEGDYGVKGFMSFETAKKAISLFIEGKKNFHLIFFGGEPLLNYSVIQKIVEWTKTLPCKFTYAITTNGTLLNEEKIKWMNEYDFAVTISD